MQDKTIGELKIRLKEVVDRLSQLIKRVTEKTELGVFLCNICRVLIAVENWFLRFVIPGFRAWYEGELGEGDGDYSGR